MSTFTLEQRVPRILEVLPAGIALSPENLDSFVALVHELRAHGATVVAVATPYAPQLEAALVKRHPAWRDERDAGYGALADAAQLPIISVHGYGEWWTDQAQNDLRHLSRDGAGPFTRQLWDMPGFREPILAIIDSAG